MINRIALKTRAKEILNLNMWNLMLGYGLAILLPSLMLSAGTYSSTGNSFDSTTPASSAASSGPEAFFIFMLALGALIVVLVILMVFIVASSLAASLATSAYQRMCLMAYDGVDVKVENLVDVKEFWSKLLWLNFWRGLRIFAWSLLFIIPGIVAAYSYSQARYILFADPEKSPAQCIDESTALMRGHKWELFILDLSFILWGLLVLVTLGMAAFYVTPYYIVTHAGFHRELLTYKQFVYQQSLAQQQSQQEVYSEVQQETPITVVADASIPATEEGAI